MKYLTVATFNTELAAQPLERRLNALGVKARISNQKMLQRLWFLSKPYGAFHLEAPVEDLARVDALLARWQAEECALSEALRCPECGSIKVQYPQMSRKYALPTLIAHGLTLCGLLRHEFFCTDCQHTWPKPTKTGRHTLMAPGDHRGEPPLSSPSP